ncbi:hypothetical protein D5S17_13285 [Pseudonocardiaceae bacterium YIM PH 21723]|nr:hypothetical protein D5S17_13285 [Pseudonocardiaceae bacterium YIM PH 21723]
MQTSTLRAAVLGTGRPALLMRDDRLADHLLGVATAVGCAIDRVPDGTELRRQWTSAELVLLDERALAECRQLRRRPHVYVLTGSPPTTVLLSAAMDLGVQRVICLPEQESVLTEILADAAESVAAPEGQVLGVIGGRGGAGASTLSAAVAIESARRGEPTFLVDCDPLGGGLDLVLGAESSSGMRWPELELGDGRVPASALRAALPSAPVRSAEGTGAVSLLSCARQGAGPTGDMIRAVLDSGMRAGETVICDLPRQLTDASSVVFDRADLIVVLIPAEVRATVAARRVVEQLESSAAVIEAVVRGPAPGGLLPAEVADGATLPLLTYMRAQPALSRSADRGQAALRSGPLSVAAKAVLDELERITGRNP